MSLHQQAVQLVKDVLESEAKLLAVLVKMKGTLEYVGLGYANLFEYLHHGLKLSRAQAYYFWKVADKSCEVPALQAAVEEGRLSISQARRIVPVVKAENVEAWIEKAEELPQAELEVAVAEENPKAAPRDTLKPIAAGTFELRCQVSMEFKKALDEMQDVLSRKRRGPATVGDTLEFMMEAALEKHSELRRAQRAEQRVAKAGALATGKAPAKGGVTEATPVSSGNSSAAKVGARVERQLTLLSVPFIPARQGGKRTAVPLPVKNHVVLRDGNRCTFVNSNGVRCSQTRWVEKHHPTMVSEGGGHEAGNLATLCSAHHRWEHAC